MARPLLTNPLHWDVVTLEPFPLGEYIRMVDSGGTPSTTESDCWDGDIPWLTPKDITRNNEKIFVSTTERNITETGLKDSAAKLLPPGTVMLTKRAPVGAVAINAVPMATNQGFLNFQCGNKLRPLYLAYWFKVNLLYLQQVANGSTYRELYKGDLFEFQIAVPPVEEQDAILNTINTLQYVFLLGLPIEQSVTSPSEMLKVQEQSRRLADLINSLLVQLLSGKIDASSVSNSLLEKIYAN